MAKVVGAYINREFDGVQRRAERGMGISQAHLSGILNPGSRRGPGISTLLQLREVMRVSLDDLLGLEPMGIALTRTQAAIRSALEEVIEEKGVELRLLPGGNRNEDHSDDGNHGSGGGRKRGPRVRKE